MLRLRKSTERTYFRSLLGIGARSCVECLSYFLIAVQNTPQPHIRGGKVYFISWCAGVSVRGQVAPRQGYMAEEQHGGGTVHGVAGRRRQAAASLGL